MLDKIIQYQSPVFFTILWVTMILLRDVLYENMNLPSAYFFMFFYTLIVIVVWVITIGDINRKKKRKENEK